MKFTKINQSVGRSFLIVCGAEHHQIAVPTRTDVPEYQKLTSQVHEIVGRINGRFGSLTTVPIHHLRGSESQLKYAKMQGNDEEDELEEKEDGGSTGIRIWSHVEKASRLQIILLWICCDIFERLVPLRICNEIWEESVVVTASVNAVEMINPLNEHAIILVKKIHIVKTDEARTMSYISLKIVYKITITLGEWESDDAKIRYLFDDVTSKTLAP
ncbi:alpha,alpha-trehalose-phosphate synthase [UDP-forming] 1-like protein [Tanacetum coccineum]